MNKSKILLSFFILTLILITGLFTSCSKSSPTEDTPLKATLEFLFSEDSFSIKHATWCQSGLIYYISTSESSDSAKLCELNPGSGTRRIILDEVYGPLDGYKDGRIAVMETATNCIVIDSTGEILWERSTGSTVNTISFSSDGEGLYLGKNGLVLYYSLDVPVQVDTILTNAGPFSISPNDSFIIYTKDTTISGELYHIFIKYDIVTGVKNIILQERYSEGFDIHPSEYNQIAIGLRGNGIYKDIGRKILLYRMNYGIGRVFEASPSDTCSIFVNSWSPEGSELLITVQPYVPGNPATPLPEELWLARDLY
jgi:hypothetical protein